MVTRSRLPTLEPLRDERIRVFLGPFLSPKGKDGLSPWSHSIFRTSRFDLAAIRPQQPLKPRPEAGAYGRSVAFHATAPVIQCVTCSSWSLRCRWRGGCAKVS